MTVTRTPQQAARLRRLADVIEADVDNFDMGSWFRPVGGPLWTDFDDTPLCGTTHCAAGTALLLMNPTGTLMGSLGYCYWLTDADGETVWKGTDAALRSETADWLGLSHEHLELELYEWTDATAEAIAAVLRHMADGLDAHDALRSVEAEAAA